MGCCLSKPPPGVTEAEIEELRELRRRCGESPDWRLLGGHELEPHLAHTDLIDAAWLLDLANGKVMPERSGIVPPWQLVPSEAKVSLDRLRKTAHKELLPVGVLSYGWAAKSHPDPTGALLRRLKPVLEAMVHSCKHGPYRYIPSYKPEAWGILWDFLSFPQRGHTSGYDADVDDRTPYERARFKSGLEGINVWYGAPHVTTLVCDWPMPPGAENTASLDSRGWCVFERSLSSVRKESNCYLALSRLPQGDAELYWHDNVVRACEKGRLPPPRPDAFETTLRNGITSGAVRFTNGKDATEICIPQYREAFLRLMGVGGAMNFHFCEWEDADVQQLAAALKYSHEAGAPTQADRLSLCGNRLTAAALPPLLEAIAMGAMPLLHCLDLDDNELGREGIAMLANALSEGRLPTVTGLDICNTRMDETSAALLAQSLGGSPKLERLSASLNLLGEAAKAKLRAACEENGVTVVL